MTTTRNDFKDQSSPRKLTITDGQMAPHCELRLTEMRVPSTAGTVCLINAPGEVGLTRADTIALRDALSKIIK